MLKNIEFRLYIAQGRTRIFRQVKKNSILEFYQIRRKIKNVMKAHWYWKPARLHVQCHAWPPFADYISWTVNLRLLFNINQSSIRGRGPEKNPPRFSSSISYLSTLGVLFQGNATGANTRFRPKAPSWID